MSILVMDAGAIGSLAGNVKSTASSRLASICSSGFSEQIALSAVSRAVAASGGTSMGVTPIGESPGEEGRPCCFASSLRFLPVRCAPGCVIENLRFSSAIQNAEEVFLRSVSLEKNAELKFRQIQAARTILDAAEVFAGILVSVEPKASAAARMRNFVQKICP